jgi:uncharacterized protein (DUF433 family)
VFRSFSKAVRRLDLGRYTASTWFWENFGYYEAMTTAALPKHVLIDERGIAWIKGTRVKVVEIALDHAAHGWSAEEIARQHPDLTLGQIHSALSCYYDNQAEFEEMIAESYESARSLSCSAGDTPLRLRLRAKGLLH